MRKVNDTQIDELYTFTRKHFVEWYDLQTELVDHMALAIEKQWEEHPEYSFEKARDIEFKKFGVFGFMGVVEERQKALGKHYNKIIWSHLKEFFTVPKILLTLSLTAFVFFLLKEGWVDRLAFMVGMVIFCIVLFVDLFMQSRKYKKQFKAGKPKWMFEDMLMRFGSGTGFSFFPVHIFQFVNLFDSNAKDFSESSVYFLIFFSSLIVVIGLLYYVMRFEIPAKAREYLIQTYPEYELA